LREVPLSEVERYGIATVEDRGEGNYVIQDLVEKPPPHEAPSRLAVCGRYLLTPQIFECLELTGPGINDEIQLTDALKQLLQKQPVYGTRLSSPVFDVGDKMGFLQATVEYALRRDDLGPAFCEFLVQRLKSVSQRDLAHVAITVEDRLC
jgi:UTP--glucose-1-phosphate uridylyltransferase